MKPIKFPGANVDFVKPLNWDEEKDGKCGSLPVCIDKKNGLFISVWAPNDAERERIAKGENIVLTIVGMQPPVSLNAAAIQGDRIAYTELDRLVDLALTVKDNTDSSDAQELAIAVIKEFTDGR